MSDREDDLEAVTDAVDYAVNEVGDDIWGARAALARLIESSPDENRGGGARRVSRFIRHDELRMIQEAVEAYREVTAGTVIPVSMAGVTKAIAPGDTLARRVEQALRGADWRIVEQRERERA